MVNFEKDSVVFARLKGRCFWPATIKAFNKKSGEYEIEFIGKEDSIRERKQINDLLQFEEMLDKFKNSKQQGIEQAIQTALEMIVLSQENRNDGKLKKSEPKIELPTKNVRFSRSRSAASVQPQEIEQQLPGKKRKLEEKKDEESLKKKRKVQEQNLEEEEEEEEIPVTKALTKKQLQQQQQQLAEEIAIFKNQQVVLPITRVSRGQSKNQQLQTQQQQQRDSSPEVIITVAPSSARKRRVVNEDERLDNSPAKNSSKKPQLKEKAAPRAKQIAKPRNQRTARVSHKDDMIQDCSSPSRQTSPRMTTRITNSQKKYIDSDQKQQSVRASSRQRKASTRLAEQESPEFGRKRDNYHEDRNSLNKNLFNTLFRSGFDQKSKIDSPFGFNANCNNLQSKAAVNNNNNCNNAANTYGNRNSNSKRNLFEDLEEASNLTTTANSFNNLNNNQNNNNNTNIGVRQVLQFENDSSSSFSQQPLSSSQYSQQNQLSPILNNSTSSALQSPFDAPSFFSDFLAGNFNFNTNNAPNVTSNFNLNSFNQQPSSINNLNKDQSHDAPNPCTYFPPQSSFHSPIALASTSPHKIYIPSPNKPFSSLNISNNSSFKFSPSPQIRQTESEGLRDCSIERALRDRIIPILESKIKSKSPYGHDNEKDLWLCDIMDVVRSIKTVNVEQLVRGEIAMLLEQVYDGLLNIQEQSKRNLQYVLSLVQRTIADLDRKIIAHLHDYSRLRGEKYRLTRERQIEAKKNFPTFIKIEDKDDDEVEETQQQHRSNHLGQRNSEEKSANLLLTKNDLRINQQQSNQSEQSSFLEAFEGNEKNQQLSSGRKLKEEVYV